MKITVLLTACDDSAPFEILHIHSKSMEKARRAIEQRFERAVKTPDRRCQPRPEWVKAALRKAWLEKRDAIIAAQNEGKARVKAGLQGAAA